MVGILAVMTADATRNHAKLAKLVRLRRSELGMTLYGTATKANLSKDTYKRVEDGRTVRDGTYLSIEKALDWEPGTCIGILESAETEIDEQTIAPAKPITEEDINQALLAGIVANTDLSAPQIRAIRDSVIGELKRRGHL